MQFPRYAQLKKANQWMLVGLFAPLTSAKSWILFD